MISSGLTRMVSAMGTALTGTSRMQAALSNLKGAAATAAAPLIQTLTPALSALANAAATVFSYLSQLISFFTGKSVSAMASAARGMERTISGQKVTLRATGNPRRDAATAVNQMDWKNLKGKMLEISAGVDGLNIKASQLSGAFTQLSQTVDSITLTAKTDGDTSKLNLSANGIELSSANITFSGMVTYAALSTPGKSIINGGNITTGTIGSEAGNTVYNLDAGTLRTGRSGSNRVEIDDRGIKWYVENAGQSYLTGVLYSKYGATYIGDNSRYTFLGWFSSSTPNFGWSSGGPHGDFVGIAIDQTGATIHCNANKFEIPGRIECSSLAVNGREI